MLYPLSYQGLIWTRQKPCLEGWLRTKRSFLYYLSTTKGDRNMADRFVSVWSNSIFLYQKSDYSKRMVVRQVKNKTKRENPVGSSRHRRGALAVVTHICSTHQMLSPTHHPYLGAPDISDVYLLTLERPDAFDHIIHIRKDQNISNVPITHI